MSGVADLMDAGMSRMSDAQKGTLCSKKAMNMSMLGVYCVCATWIYVISEHFSDKDFSVVLTLSSLSQFLGFVLLSLKVRSAKSGAGVSSRTLEMYFLFFIFRLTSTICKNGYLPIDRSGDWVYQSADVMSVFVVLHLLYVMHKRFGTTYQAEHDTLNTFKAIPVCLVMACFVKGDLNASLLFDWVWCVSMLIDTLAMLPQLWMMTKIGGEVDGMTAHYVVALTVSRVFAFWFWWHGYTELHIKNQTYNVAGYTVLAAHFTQLVFCADFGYYYAKSMFTGATAVLLPTLDV